MTFAGIFFRKSVLEKRFETSDFSVTADGVFIDTGVGKLHIAAADCGLVLCDWCRSPKYDRNRRQAFAVRIAGEGRVTALEIAAAVQVNDFLQGRRCSLDLPFAPQGTVFQRRVWQTLRRVGWGARVSYAQLAQMCGVPHAVRAVANAVAANPLSIVVPCHRVVCADGRLGNYAGGVLAKRFLLDVESQTFGENRMF